MNGFRGKRIARCVVLAALLVLLVLVGATHAREPLPVPGKQSLQQRILTRPGARLADRPAGRLLMDAPLPALNAYYVYARANSPDGGPDGGWLEIGASGRDGAQGWIPASKAIDWHQTLTVAFKRTDNRDPVLFFENGATLQSLLESEGRVRRITELRERLAGGQAVAELGIVAVEPSEYVNPNRNFYLLPILEHRRVFLESGYQARLLDVAAVTVRPDAEEAPVGATAPADGAGNADLAGYRAGVVFVIDTTSSMGPYIARTREAVARVYDRLKSSELGHKLSFGLIAFRDNVDAAPGLGYVSRVVASLEDGLDGERFLSKIASVDAATVSSKGFVEDALAGVRDGIEKIDWRGYDGRYLVLITDAGARDANDPLARDGIGVPGLRSLADDKDQDGVGGKIAIATLHLLTPEGQATESRAAAQYRALSKWGQAGDLYFPIPDASPQAFGRQVDALTRLLLDRLSGAADGKLATPITGDDDDSLAARTAQVSRAMQLAYLGRLRDRKVPDLIRASILDRDLLQQALFVVQVRMMITKNQLSDLQHTLSQILAAGERTFMEPRDFFAQLRGAAAALARDPTQATPSGVEQLADVGHVAEWLDGLPYRSQVMNLTEERWLSRGYSERQEVLDVLEAKIRLYQSIHDDTSRWVRLGDDSPPGEAVTTIPLDALP